MKKTLTTLAILVAGTPALAASGPFFSLNNTDFVVTIAFVVFIGILLYLKVPGIVGKLLDDRAAGIARDLDEARNLREEAQSLLASYERKQKEVAEQSDRIVATAKEEAKAAGEDAKVALQAAIARRLRAAEDQISSAEASAVRDVRERAVAVAVQAAGDVIAAKMAAKDANALIDAAIDDAGKRLH